MSADAESTTSHITDGLAFEAVANRKYAYFAKLARSLGDEEAARLFERIADEESAHAFAQLTVMYPPGSLTVIDLLRLACEVERSETDRKYPEFAAAARAERAAAATPEAKELLLRAERRFEALGEMEQTHLEHFEAMLKGRLLRQQSSGSGQGGGGSPA
jgi:rubrerythrin